MCAVCVDSYVYCLAEALSRVRIPLWSDPLHYSFGVTFGYPPFKVGHMGELVLVGFGLDVVHHVSPSCLHIGLVGSCGPACL
jgi:hypothetical protein